jgi:hypothetical protein
MTNDVMYLVNHFKESGLELNYSKTNFMVVTNNIEMDVPQEMILSENKTIIRTNTQKFLGILIDDKLKFNEQFSALHNKLIQSCRVISIIRHQLSQEMLLQYFHAHFLSHLNFCAFLLAKMTQEEVSRLQTLQNKCLKIIYGLDSTHPTIDIYKNITNNILPVIGIAYSSLLSHIQKSLVLGLDELLKFEANSNTRRSNGTLIVAKYKKKHRLGTDIGHLGVKLYNQLPDELKKIEKIESFKKEVKKLFNSIDLILAPDQYNTRRITAGF